MTEYIWRTSEDERVCESHRALDGTKHRYDHPPVVDRKRGRTANPGNDFQCRCAMESVIEGFDELARALKSHLPPGLNDGPTLGAITRALSTYTPPPTQGTP